MKIQKTAAAAAILCGTSSSLATVDEFATLSNQLLAVNSISVSAVVEFELIGEAECGDPPLVAGSIFKGRVDYDHDGSDWRLSSQVSPGFTTAMNVEVIKTGNDQVYIDYNAGFANTLLGAGNAQPDGPFLRIPPFAMYDYLEPAQEHSLQVSTPSTLQSTLVQTTSSTQTWTATTVDGRAMLTARLDLSATHSIPDWDLDIGMRQSQPDRPFRYEYFDQTTGLIDLRVELSNYQTITHQDGTTSIWPMLVQETVFDENGQPFALATYTVQTLVIGDAVFSADRINSRSVPTGFSLYENGVPVAGD